MSYGGFLVEYNFYEFVSEAQLLQDYSRLSSDKSFPWTVKNN